MSARSPSRSEMIVYDGIMPDQPSSAAPGKRSRGGRRAGAGRPPTYTEPLLRKTVTLPASYIRQLTWLGQGNLSDGIRLLAEQAYDRHGRLWLEVTPADEGPVRPS